MNCTAMLSQIIYNAICDALDSEAENRINSLDVGAEVMICLTKKALAANVKYGIPREVKWLRGCLTRFHRSIMRLNSHSPRKKHHWHHWSQFFERASATPTQQARAARKNMHRLMSCIVIRGNPDKTPLSVEEPNGVRST